MKLYDMQQQPASDEYTGSGWAWVAMKDDEVIAIRYMDDHIGCYTGSSPEALKHAKRKRYCKATELAAEQLNKEAFLAWRKEARTELSELGKVVTGMMSCWQFEVRTENIIMRET